ncbi:uncharacterized protein BDV17DRAFT_290278 [Aspergillus undulatus]|uniref:uncharacterized protein n=1 Tax=Aspergillus undulatus TaxID=1810928 RepID=UPI003CCCD341
MPLDVPDGTPDRGEGIVTICILLTVLTSLVTVMRVISKLLTRQYWWWDDFFAVLGYVFNVPVLSFTLYWRTIGFGLHMSTVAAIDPRYINTGVRYVFAGTLLFDAALSLPKLSAVLFYARVLRTTSRLVKAQLWIAAFLVTAWLVSTILASLLRCRPIGKAWNPTMLGTCNGQYPALLSFAIISSLIDIYILALPVPHIWGLQHVSVRRRVYLLITFFLAYSVIVLSLGRLVSTTRVIPTLDEDLTWNFVPYHYWVLFESGVSIISVNVPSGIALVKNLIKRRRRRLGLPTTNDRQRANQSGSLGPALQSIGGTPMRAKGTGDETSAERLVDEAEHLDSHREHGLVPLRDIRVRTDIRIDSHA